MPSILTIQYGKSNCRLFIKVISTKLETSRDKLIRNKEKQSDVKVDKIFPKIFDIINYVFTLKLYMGQGIQE